MNTLRLDLISSKDAESDPKVFAHQKFPNSVRQKYEIFNNN